MSENSRQHKEQQLLLLRERLRRKASTSLHEFVAQAWHVVAPSYEFRDNFHIAAICEHLEAVHRGEIRRLLINVPFRTAKSTVVSVMYPAWKWIHAPAHKFLCGSYAAKLAIRDNLSMRRLIQSPWYRERWGRGFNLVDQADWGDPAGFELTSDQNQKIRFENDRTGYRIAFGFEGGVMGDGGDDVLIDDPHDRNQAHSDKEREHALTTFDEGITTRLNDPVKSAIVIIMQRLHEQDLSGHVLAKGGYEHLLIPMHYDSSRSRTTVIGWSDPRNVDGELMHPERFPEHIVKEIEREIGSYAAAGQLEQRPSPPEGGMFKRHWFRYYKELPKIEDSCQSWDLTFKNTSGSDRVSGQAWGRAGADFYLIDGVVDRMDFPETCRAVENFAIRHPEIAAILIEDKANGPAVMQTLGHKVSGLIPVEPEGSKAARAAAVSPYFEAGNVYLPDPEAYPQMARFVAEFIEEMASFRGGLGSGFDDQVDACSQALHRLKQSRPHAHMVGFYNEMLDQWSAEKKASEKKEGEPT